MAFKMFEKYDNMPANYTPNNKTKILLFRQIKELVIGSTTAHMFILPFSYQETCRGIEVYYKQSLSKVQEATATPDNYITLEEFIDHGIEKTKVIVVLPKEITAGFNQFRATTVQVKVYFQDNTVAFGKIIPVKVIKPLDEGEDQTPADLGICQDEIACDDAKSAGGGSLVLSKLCNTNAEDITQLDELTATAETIDVEMLDEIPNGYHFV